MQDMHSSIQDLMQQYAVPGCAVSVIRDNTFILEGAFGAKTVMNLPESHIDTYTIFPIASLTKHFTAMAIGILVDQGLVAWDDPVIKHYKKLKLSNNFIQEYLTIKDCLSMGSGLGALPNTIDNFTELSVTQLLGLTAELSFDHKNYNRFSYQNLLYVLLEQVIQEVSHKSLSSFFKAYLFEPLDMHHTFTTYNELLEANNKALGHQLINNKITHIDYENLDNIKAGAGINSCAHDMSKWLQMLTNQGAYLGKSIISKKSFKEIITPYVELAPQDFLGNSYKSLQDIYFPDRTNLGYGFGFFIRDYHGVIICQTPGLADGMMASLAICPELNLGIAVLSNLERPEFVHKALFKLLDKFINTKN